MKKHIYSLIALAVLTLGLLNACADNAATPETHLTINGEANEGEGPIDNTNGNHADQVIDVTEEIKLISWILKEDIIKGVELDGPVVTVEVVEDRVERVYFSVGGLESVTDIYEDDIMMSIVEDNIIFLTDYVDNVELRIIAEDQIMLLDFTLNDEPFFSSFLTIRDDIF